MMDVSVKSTSFVVEFYSSELLNKCYLISIFYIVVGEFLHRTIFSYNQIIKNKSTVFAELSDALLA